MFHLLDLLGTFAFAFLGAQQALRLKLNMLGVLAFSAITAVGGGTIRELILNHTPFYFYDYSYLVFILIGFACAILLARTWHASVKPMILAMDAIGTATFALAGAYAAVSAQLGAPAILLFAVLTAFGGGTICDIIAHQTPRIFKNARLVLPSACIAVLYWFVPITPTEPFISTAVLLLAGTAQISIAYWPRIARITRHIQLSKVFALQSAND